MEYEQDYLTGLWTRQAMYAYYQSLEPGSGIHFMFLDVDNFKIVNDIYGHNEGDALLVNIAGILRKNAPMAHGVRMGGDEFVLIFPGRPAGRRCVRLPPELLNGYRAKRAQSIS